MNLWVPSKCENLFHINTYVEVSFMFYGSRSKLCSGNHKLSIGAKYISLACVIIH
jgi:hypothetical protein